MTVVIFSKLKKNIFFDVFAANFVVNYCETPVQDIGLLLKDKSMLKNTTHL